MHLSSKLACVYSGARSYESLVLTAPTPGVSFPLILAESLSNSATPHRTMPLTECKRFLLARPLRQEETSGSLEHQVALYGSKALVLRGQYVHVTRVEWGTLCRVLRV